MIRGENLYASGIVLLTPIELEVLEEPAGGRVRVTVRDARSGDLLPKVLIKVNGNADSQFNSGETDLRGVFVAEGLHGILTVVARQGTAQYAFNRGTTYVGQPIDVPPPPPGQPVPQAGEANWGTLNQSLDSNLKMQNTTNSLRQIERLQQRFAAPADKSKGAAAGGFR
jgi:alpha-2-macroglobulin